MTVDDCKKWLFKLGMKHKISPRIISERLLSLEDKKDILEGLVSFDALNCYVKNWKEYGMQNYANGTMKPYENRN